MTEEERIAQLEAEVLALRNLFQVYFSPHTQQAFVEACADAGISISETVLTQGGVNANP